MRCNSTIAPAEMATCISNSIHYASQELGAVELVLDLMTYTLVDHPAFTATQCEGLNALTYLAHISESLVADIIAHKGIEVVTAAMQRLPENLKVQVV